MCIHASWQDYLLRLFHLASREIPDCALGKLGEMQHRLGPHRALSSPTGQSLNKGMQGHDHKVSGHGLTSKLHPTSAGSWGHPVETSEVGKRVHKGKV